MNEGINLGGTDASNLNGDGGVCVCARACVRACMRECVCARVRACVRACVCECVRDVFAIYDNNILPRLIMIIIKLLSYISYTSDTLMISPQRVPV